MLAAAAPQIANDAPGVTVSLNGAAVLHRTGVGYPPAALREGVQGTVSLQVKLDSTGTVNDAQVLSGPDQLRKAAMESVLQWHFTQDVAGTTRVVQIAFELPKIDETAAPARITVGQPGTINSIRIVGLSEQGSAALLASLPIREGDAWNDESAQRAAAAVKAFDEHLNIRQSSMIQSPDGAVQVSLTIAYGSASQRIKVGGNIQGAMVVTKVPPVYPEAAKAAGVSGIVHLAVIIARDGTIQEIHSLGGPALLIQAAMDAVKQWVYRPTMLNGSPVQVETTVDVNFTLSQ
jgi:TonB family protein